jgi:hypothetical protein
MDDKTRRLIASIESPESARQDTALLHWLGPDLDLVCACDDCVDYYLHAFPGFHTTEGYECWKSNRAAFDRLQDSKHSLDGWD